MKQPSCLVYVLAFFCCLALSVISNRARAVGFSPPAPSRGKFFRVSPSRWGYPCCFFLFLWRISCAHPRQGLVGPTGSGRGLAAAP